MQKRSGGTQAPPLPVMASQVGPEWAAPVYSTDALKESSCCLFVAGISVPQAPSPSGLSRSKSSIKPRPCLNSFQVHWAFLQLWIQEPKVRNKPSKYRFSISIRY